MKQFAFLLLAMCAILMAAPYAHATDSRIVIRVISGDTIIVDGGQAVRLIGVFSPTGEEYYAQEARQALTTLVLGQEVDLEIDSYNASMGNKDESGRQLAYVYRASDRLFVNSSLLQQGYVYYSPKNVHKFATSFTGNEQNARKAHRGVWEKTDTSPAQRAQLIKQPYTEPAFEYKPEYKTPDLRVEILWGKKADPRFRIARSTEEAKFLTELYGDSKVSAGQLPPLVRLRRNLAEALTKFYQDQKIPLKVETMGDLAEVLKFVAEGMDQADANKFCESSFNRELFAGLEFSEVIFTDGEAFSYSYKVQP